MGIMGSVAEDDHVHCRGKEAGKTMIFLLRVLFLKVGGLLEMVASLTGP